MKRFFRQLFLHRRARISLLFGLFFVGACTTREQPEPTQTQEERRLREKEILQREMRNE